MGVRVEILGPVRLFVDGNEVSIRRSQVERALVILGAIAPEPVSQDQLIEHLWGSSLPADPKASLRVALSRLRTTLGDASDSLRSESAGYVLDTATDVADFEQHLQLARAAETDQARGHWAASSAIWRGSLNHLSDSTLLEPLQGRLLRLRAQALVEQAECLHRLGEYQDATAIAHPLHEQDLSDERVAIVTAQSLAAVGRKSVAIGVLMATRDALRDQLGLNPSSAFERIEDTILRDASGPDTLEVAKPQIAAGMTFVGRRSEHETLVGCGPGLHVLLGEPGAGKSALLAEVSRSLVDRGCTVLAVQATQTPTRAMEPLAELLSQIAGLVLVDDHTDALRSALSRLAPHLVEGAVDQPASREGLLALTGEAIQEFAAQHGDVVVMLDDAQWVDRSSIHVFDRLIDGGQIPIIVGSRASIPAAASFLLDQERQTTTLRLEPLNRADVRDLVEQHLPSLPLDATVDSLLEQSGGNPLFLTLLADLMAEGSYTGSSLPPNVLLTVQQRLAGLPAHAQRTLEIASVFAEAFPLVVLADLAPTAQADIDLAIEQGLVVETDGPKLFRFVHTLVAESAYQLLADGTRLELHDEVGRLLEAWGAPAAEYSLHCGEAAQLDPIRAVRAHLFAAHEFASAFDWETALLHAERGLGYEADYQVEHAELSADLRVVAGSSLRSQGKSQGDSYLVAGVELAVDNENTETALKGLLALCTHGRMSSPVGDTIYSLLKRVLAAGLTVAQRAQLLACEGSLLAISPQQERGRQAHERAFEMLERCDDLDATREVLLRTHLGFPHPADFARRVLATDMLQEIAGNDPDLLWEVAFLRFGSAMVQDDAASAQASLEEMRSLTPRIRVRQRTYGLRFSEAAWARYQNDLDQAETLLDQAMEIGKEFFDGGWTQLAYIAFLSSIRQAQGRLHELMPLLSHWAEADPDWPNWRVVAAGCAASVGDRDRVHQELEWLKRDDFACLSPDVSWAAMISILAEPVEMVADAKAAKILAGLLEPYQGLNLWNGFCIHGSVDDVMARFRRVASGP